MENLQIGQVVKLKKPHPCGTNLWKIIRIGADFRLQCLNCKRSIMISRPKFEKKLKKIVEADEVESELGS